MSNVRHQQNGHDNLKYKDFESKIDNEIKSKLDMLLRKFNAAHEALRFLDSLETYTVLSFFKAALHFETNCDYQEKCLLISLNSNEQEKIKGFMKDVGFPGMDSENCLNDNIFYKDVSISKIRKNFNFIINVQIPESSLFSEFLIYKQYKENQERVSAFLMASVSPSISAYTSFFAHSDFDGNLLGKITSYLTGVEPKTFKK